MSSEGFSASTDDSLESGGREERNREIARKNLTPEQSVLLEQISKVYGVGRGNMHFVLEGQDVRIDAKEFPSDVGLDIADRNRPVVGTIDGKEITPEEARELANKYYAVVNEMYNADWVQASEKP